MSTFLIADPHFFHAGIIRLCQRPFADVREMNNVLKMSWNAVVGDNDDVIVLGDFAHRAGDAKELRALFDSLQGRKHLVIGNHDGPNTLALPWATPPKDILLCSVESTRLVLCHYAMRVWPSMRKGSTLHLFGHSHGRLAGTQRSADIGVDVLGWAPLRLNQIKAHLAKLPPLSDLEGDPDPNGGVTP
ncbi:MULTISPECIES: metallophosphoesterase [unclassified Bradyrhizobium]|uniref:metallophosphoesterase n=1 Tax=unclassified Bradyrhizobium TaxID=2631580 RepID=UPI002FEEA80D